MAPPQKIHPPKFVMPSARTIVSIGALCILFVIAVDTLGDALHNYGLNRLWSVLILLGVGVLGRALWKTIRKRRKVANHQKWVSGLGDGFAQRLEEARLEAKRWQGKNSGGGQ